MPVAFNIHPRHGFILASVFGQIRARDFGTLARDCATDPANRAEQNIMIDTSGHDRDETDAVGRMPAIAQVFGHLRPGQSAIPDCVVRIVQGHREGFDIFGFSTRNHQCAWCGVKV